MQPPTTKDMLPQSPSTRAINLRTTLSIRASKVRGVAYVPQ